jgi:dTDP-glucose 4,6-dehydratase
VEQQPAVVQVVAPSRARVLLTGAAGFVGSHMLRRLRYQHPDWEVICPVTMRHHGSPDRLTDLAGDEKITFLHTDLSWGLTDTVIDKIGDVDIIMNIASGSGVEESIADPQGFVRNNIELMMNLLELARRGVEPDIFLHMGTDEEYGPAPQDVYHKEWETALPSNPYAASKAAQSALAVSYWRTYGVPVVLTKSMNLIGPGQSQEKLVPTVIRKVLAGETVPIYAENGVPGSRCWIDVRDFADAWMFLLDQEIPLWPENDRPGLWHIVGPEYTNLELAEMIGRVMDLPVKTELVETYAIRPGHDLRYALDGTKLADAGWERKTPIVDTIADTVQWYLENRSWL